MSEDEDPMCMVDYSQSTRIHYALVCQTNLPAPRCGLLRLSEDEDELRSAFCEDGETPAWAARLETPDEVDEADDDAAPVDDYALDFDGDTAVVVRHREPAAGGPEPGRYSLDEIFALMEEVTLQ